MVVLPTSCKYKRNKEIGIHRKKSVLTDRNDCVGRGKSVHLLCLMKLPTLCKERMNKYIGHLLHTRVRDKKRLEKVGNLVKNSYLYR